jgi:hypothetical protein
MSPSRELLHRSPIKLKSDISSEKVVQGAFEHLGIEGYLRGCWEECRDEEGMARSAFSRRICIIEGQKVYFF